jgi:hypothetical protein
MSLGISTLTSKTDSAAVGSNDGAKVPLVQ